MLALMKWSRLPVLAAIVCVSSAAFLACAAQDAPESYSVRGMVLNSITRQPIARALVDANSDAVLTDNQGRFELNLHDSFTQINVRRPGYNSNGRNGSHPVRVGANMPDLTFYLIPDASITGNVTLSSGDEASGIHFMAYRRRTLNGHPSWMMQGQAVTNSEGVFRLENLDAPATYVVCAMPTHDRIGAVAPGATSFGYPSVCYPDAGNFSTANLIAVAAGQQAQLEISLNKQPFYPVSFAVKNSQPGQGMGIQIYDPSGRMMGFSTRWNSEEKLAEVNLPNGRYYAEARFGGKPPSYGCVDFTVANGPVQALSMVLLPLHPIQVEIHKDFTANPFNGLQGGSAPATFVIDGPPLQDFNPGLNLMLVPAGEFSRGMNGGLRHVDGSSDNSLFEIDNVTPGRYWVQATAFQGYVYSMTSGGVDLAREPLVIGPGNTAEPIQITIRNDGGQISGMVKSTSSIGASAIGSSVGEIAAIFVYAIPLFPTSAQIPQTMAQNGGQFTLPNLPPGSYRVVAFDGFQEIDTAEAQELSRLTTKGQTVTVESGGTASVQLDVTQSRAEGATQ
ncbi:MAG: carboxypeptidase-like regulatory domain-containing protein [Terracidiphilus sp.]